MRNLLILVVLSSSLWAQSSRDQARQADLNYVATQVPKLHANFFFQLKPADFNGAVQSLMAQIPTLSDAQFYAGLAKLVAMAGDEHTVLNLDNAAAVRAGFQTFPLQFRWLDDGVFVTAASGDYSRALGAQLMGVGDSPIDAVVQKLGTVIPRPNSQWLHYMSQSYLRGQQILQGLDIVPATPTTRLTFRSLGGEEFTLDVGAGASPLISAPAPDQGPVPDYLQHTDQFYWFTYSAPLRLLYFKYNQCAQTPGNPFDPFAAKLLSTLDTNPVDTLVIDFRGNTGGDETIIGSLYDGLIARIPAFLANPNFRVYGVIDKGTFSAAMGDAEILKTPASYYETAVPSNFDPGKIVRVIGEPTGGAPAHYGQVAQFVLPNSRLTGQYSTQYIDAPPYITADLEPGGPSFGPDIAVRVRSSDFFARHDPVLAAIIARWEGAPKAPSGDVIAVNGASFHVEQGLAPGSFASAFGSFPAGVDGIQVNGQAGQIVSASQSQINFVVPPAVSPGLATVSARSGSSEVAAGRATITSAGPGLFVSQPADPSQPGAVLNENSSVNGGGNRASVGSIVQIFATGYGPLDSSQNAPAQVYFDDVPSDVVFSGPIAQFPGLWQINARVPTGGPGQVSLFVVAGNIASNAVTVWVQ